VAKIFQYVTCSKCSLCGPSLMWSNCGKLGRLNTKAGMCVLKVAELLLLVSLV